MMMDYSIKIIDISEEVIGVMLFIKRKSGKFQLFYTTLRIISKEDNQKWMSYFVYEAEKLHMDIKYENEDIVIIKTNI